MQVLVIIKENITDVTLLHFEVCSLPDWNTTQTVECTKTDPKRRLSQKTEPGPQQEVK